MEKEVITLRGHHLYGLYLYKKKQDVKAFNGKILNILRGRKKYTQPYQYGYMEEQIANTKNLFERILKDPNISIKINESLDDICTNCKGKRELCTGDKEKIDKMARELVELDNEKIYSQKEILEKVLLNDKIASFPVLQFYLAHN